MAYTTAEARQELLDTVARAANELGLASACLAEAYDSKPFRVRALARGSRRGAQASPLAANQDWAEQRLEQSSLGQAERQEGQAAQASQEVLGGSPLTLFNSPVPPPQ